jgi:glutathione peroxidase
MRTEPGSNEDIKKTAQKYGATFVLFDKIEVNGPGAHPLYQWLVTTHKNTLFGSKILWNFEKFLIDRNGRVVTRFNTLSSFTNVESEIQKLL